MDRLYSINIRRSQLGSGTLQTEGSVLFRTGSHTSPYLLVDNYMKCPYISLSETFLCAQGTRTTSYTSSVPTTTPPMKQAMDESQGGLLCARIISHYETIVTLHHNTKLRHGPLELQVVVVP